MLVDLSIMFIPRKTSVVLAVELAQALGHMIEHLVILLTLYSYSVFQVWTCANVSFFKVLQKSLLNQHDQDRITVLEQQVS